MLPKNLSKILSPLLSIDEFERVKKDFLICISLCFCSMKLSLLLPPPPPPRLELPRHYQPFFLPILQLQKKLIHSSFFLEISGLFFVPLIFIISIVYPLIIRMKKYSYSIRLKNKI